MSRDLKLLIIEDSEDDVLLALRELEKSGFKPSYERVESPEELREALGEDKWDAIIADYNMPAFNALKALEIYRESGLDIPFIVVSGTIGEDVAVETMKRGAHDYVMKDNLTRLGVAMERELREHDVRRERKKALEALKDSETRYRSLFDTMHEGFALHEIICDEEGNPCDFRFLDMNPAYEKLSGLSCREVTGKTIREVRPGMDLTRIRAYGEVALTGRPARIEDHDAERRCYFDVLAFSPAKGQFATLVTDITARKNNEAERQRLQEQFQHTQKLESLGILAGGIAHDFNNLLMGILGNASLAKQDISPDSPVRETVDAIEISARRAAELTRQLLAYSGKGRFLVKPLNISDMVREMTHILETVISKDAVLKLNLGETSTVVADVTQIRQVLMNLITNASDALMNSGGSITITTSVRMCDKDYLSEIYLGEEPVEGPYVCIEVSDTGIGMDRETLKRMFDPFFTTKFTGRGLGLAAVLGIIRGHKGALKVYSEPNKGSTFKVLLPTEQAQTVNETRQPYGDEKWQCMGTVLVVDDEESVRNTARAMLKKAGFDVLLAEDGCEALDIFREKRSGISAVLLDLTMPRLGGEQTYRQLMEIDPNVLVILSSGFTEQDALENFDGSSGVLFIQKPYSFSELMDKLKGALAR